MSMGRSSVSSFFDIQGLSRQFWLLIAAIFVLLSGMFMAFPFLTLYLNGPLDVSIATIGLIMGTMTFVGIPFQVAGGALTDRLGRKPALVIAILATVTLYLGVGFAPSLWVVVLVFGVEAAFGWSLFLTSSNAMTADLVPFERRAQAYSLTRTAISAGSGVGPLLAAAVLAATASYRTSFVIGSSVCILVAASVVILFRETRPPSGAGRGAAGAASNSAPAGVVDRDGSALEQAHLTAGSSVIPSPTWSAGDRAAPPDRPSGTYRRILHDRRFLFLLLAAFATSFSFAQIPTTLPVLLSTVHDVQPQSWALLLSVHSISLAVLQYPVVRVLRGRDALGLIGVGSVLIGGSLTAIAFLPWGLMTFLLVVTMAVGVALFMPLVPTVVSHMAPVDLRGRYMALWSLAYIVGFGSGPLIGGRAMESLGARGGYVVVGLVALVGALLFWTLAVAVRRRRTPVRRSTA